MVEDDGLEGFELCEACDGRFDSADLRNGLCQECAEALDNEDR